LPIDQRAGVRVLLTGATGFLGSRVAASLAGAGHAVTGLVRPRPRAAPPPGAPTAVECDLADAARLARVLDEVRPEAVVHLAWFTQHGAYWSATENCDCVAHSVQLVRLAAERGCRRFVGAGTCAEYDWSHPRPIENVTPCAPRSLYGASKLAVFLVAERLAALSGMSLAWARYGFLFGPGESEARLVTAAIRALAAGAELACSEGTQIRDFVYVGEAAAATTALLGADVTGPVNIGAGEPVAIRELIEIIRALTGGSGQPRYGALAARPDDPPVLVPDLSRLHDEVGWRPRLTLREALAATVEAWRESNRASAAADPA
jgi:nucleoside-diphosphate-sugar epimerase